VLNNGVHFTHL